ncbi:hypothetical protein PENARI_c056G10484 [Penicillium arizonense]|uniref:Uncharacterized protein n=1 Tax=Penicillium arizonense TaxID=1835702 RepID=A0A1F5L1S2_PENAI|nr:hypothetical protein PENARI_c056G10484 [Penicillium arizonense]
MSKSSAHSATRDGDWVFARY